MLTKDVAIGFKDISKEKRTVCGYFSHFGSKDYAGDVVVPGAFKDAIALNGVNGTQLIKHLLDHDKKQALGQLTMLAEDQTGLYYESKVGRHTLGNDFLLMVEDGIINQHSFGYYVQEERKSANGDNELIKLDLLEGSSIQFRGCNPNTPVTGLKTIEQIFEDLTVLEKALRDGKYTDETFIKLEQHIKALYKALPVPEVKSYYSLLN